MICRELPEVPDKTKYFLGAVGGDPFFLFFVFPNEVRDLGFCTWRQEPGFLALLGMTNPMTTGMPNPMNKRNEKEAYASRF